MREIKVIKVPRNDTITDKPPRFAPLQNLHLDLMEIKKKLKKNLPIVTIKSTPPPQIKVPPVQRVEESAVETDEIEIEFVETDESADYGEAEGGEDWEAEGDETDEVTKEFGVDPPDSGKRAGGATSTPVASAPPEESVPDPNEGKTPEQIEAEEKEEYMWRWKILGKKYPEKQFPKYSEHDDLHTMKTAYTQTIKEITLEGNVDNYKTYLIGGFMAIQYGFTYGLGIDFTGFAAQQTLMMHKYDSMLIELGERSYTSFGSNLPVEIKLIGFILFQAALFWIAKMLGENGSDNIAAVLRSLSGQPPVPVGSTPGEAPKKKMRGPSIKVDDMRRTVPEDDVEN